ncbi:BON domain-containing protein [Xylophilus rhododendri]|uniref:BON domain-containing protein n=1 Tax=Xylophilus rhododendri TaxID=2697032 RepID=A0A857JBY6_9BURK|nr:BON domain-containing protein [Xylophilus rhododendri]QHJ01188.1 BON domain-containing protein [Xylophilus rhododendri]
MISRMSLRTCASAIALSAIAMAMSGCQKSPEPTTVGQKVDAAIDKTKDVAADVRTEARTALSDAQTRLNQDGPKVEQRAKAAATLTAKVIDDAAITAQVSAGLARDPDLSAIKIDVDTKDGAVILRGPAPSADARERAGQLARGVLGVVSVDNQLVVKTG